jgi:hypothetical protein
MTSFLSTITQRKKSPGQLVISAKVSVSAYLEGENAAEENMGKRLVQIKEEALEIGSSMQSVSSFVPICNKR